jgi:hypothetical protein
MGANKVDEFLEIINRQSPEWKFKAIYGHIASTENSFKTTMRILIEASRVSFEEKKVPIRMDREYDYRSDYTFEMAEYEFIDAVYQECVLYFIFSKTSDAGVPEGFTVYGRDYFLPY